MAPLEEEERKSEKCYIVSLSKHTSTKGKRKKPLPRATVAEYLYGMESVVLR